MSQYDVPRQTGSDDPRNVFPLTNEGGKPILIIGVFRPVSTTPLQDSLETVAFAWVCHSNGTPIREVIYPAQTKPLLVPTPTNEAHGLRCIAIPHYNTHHDGQMRLIVEPVGECFEMPLDEALSAVLGGQAAVVGHPELEMIYREVVRLKRVDEIQEELPDLMAPATTSRMTLISQLAPKVSDPIIQAALNRLQAATHASTSTSRQPRGMPRQSPTMWK